MEWISEALFFARASAHPPTAEPSRTTFLREELARTPRASHSDDAKPDQGASLNVRNTKSDVNLAETPPDEAEDNARTFCCKGDEHGERFKPFRKSVLESKTYDWNHGRIEGTPACFAHLQSHGKVGR